MLTARFPPAIVDIREDEMQTRHTKRIGLTKEHVGAPELQTNPAFNDLMKELITREGSSPACNMEELGCFVDFSQVEPILKLLWKLPKVWHLGFRLTSNWLRDTRAVWPNGRIPAQKVIAPLRDAFRGMKDDLDIINNMRDKMFELTPLKWWAQSEYDIVVKLTDSLRRLAGLSMRDCQVPGKEVYCIVDVLRKMADDDEFSLSQNVLAALRKYDSPPCLVRDDLETFELKMNAVRRQILNVALKYQQCGGVLKPLEVLVEQLEEEVKGHEQKHGECLDVKNLSLSHRF